MESRTQFRAAASSRNNAPRSTVWRLMLVILCLVTFAAGIVVLPHTTSNVSAQNTQGNTQDIPSVQSVTPK